ncbi:MAG: DUF1553 domain-containing protein [Phycisphaeraceae bacterium]
MKRYAVALVAVMMLIGMAGSPRASGADAAAAPLPAPLDRAIDFTKDVQPVLAKHCVSCHGPEKQKSGLRLDQSASVKKGGNSGEPVYVVGKSAESHIIKLVAGLIEDEIMPPKGARLSAEEIGILRAWIDQGAKWPDDGGAGTGPVKLTHWSFQPVRRVEPADAKAQALRAWVRNPIDAFIAAKLEEKGLQPSKEADKETLVRRAYLLITGLAPTPAQRQAFLDDSRGDAFERLVDGLLASPRYGERWARHWMDVARFAETNGFETNTPRPTAWHYRDYVIRAFNENTPYDRFVQEQIAGDSLGEDAATGFLVGGAYDVVKSPDPVLTANQRADEIHDMINTTSTAFLGVTVACARCHNHKFDPVSQKDYFAFAAVFAGVNHGERAIKSTGDAEKERQIADLLGKIAGHRAELAKFETPPQPVVGEPARTIVIDDEQTSGVASVAYLIKPQPSPGMNPSGALRGYRDDAGDVDRLPNLSGGRYAWWTHDESGAGKDYIAYHPNAAGRFRLWLSWGCGWHTHCADTQYLVDVDGDLSTKDDQKPIATIDQQRFGDGTGEPVSKPLWSGLSDVGVVELKETSRIVMRGGKTGSAITADIIVLQEVKTTQDPGPKTQDALAHQPRLREPANAKLNEERFAPQKAKFVRFNIATTNGGEPCIDELEIFSVASDAKPSTNIALASLGSKLTSSGDYVGNPKHKLEHLNDGKLSNDFSWISNTPGKGWVTVELAEPAWIERINWGRDRTEGFKDRTATSYRFEVSDDGQKWMTVASSSDRLPFGMKVEDITAYRFVGLTGEQAKRARQIIDELKAWDAQLGVISQMPRAYAGTFAQPAPTRRFYRGDPMEPREVVEPGAIESLGRSLDIDTKTPERERRAALAKWITSKDNPLTARVMVNRIWHWHFGEGLVSTPSDFGKMGSTPTHPELLDWLADEFMKSGWNVKHMQKLIVTSTTWRQDSAPSQGQGPRAKGQRAEQGIPQSATPGGRDPQSLDPQSIDADSRYLWRFPPRRLEAEAIRDGLLQVAGSLDLTMGGPGWNAFKDNSNYVRVYTPKDDWDKSDWRRMIYMYKVRVEHDATFGVFDCPDAGQPTDKRGRSTTALQALNLLNSGFVLEQAELFAARLEKESPKDVPAQVRRAFLLCFGREATQAEVDGAQSLVSEYGLKALCRAMINANEFLFVQ